MEYSAIGKQSKDQSAMNVSVEILDNSLNDTLNDDNLKK